jgi:hypothetical protein
MKQVWIIGYYPQPTQLNCYNHSEGVCDECNIKFQCLTETPVTIKEFDSCFANSLATMYGKMERDADI